MGTGFLEVVTTTALGGMPVVGAKITVSSGSEILYTLTTDASGLTKTVALEAPPRALTLDENFDGIPYSVCDVRAEADGFMSVTIHDVEILDTETSILPIHMSPAMGSGRESDLYIPLHNLVSDEDRRMDVPPEQPIPATPRVLNEVIIPEFITVHLGRPDNRNARNVRVPFVYYIKNVTSHEIFSTWPPASLEANIYCIISLTLNRIFTKSHRMGMRLIVVCAEKGLGLARIFVAVRGGSDAACQRHVRNSRRSNAAKRPQIQVSFRRKQL